MTFTTNFKGPRVSQKTIRFRKRMDRDARERAAKDAVRHRDPWCRFPLCGCKGARFSRHVSHAKHKGMGGNPKEDRSVPELMMALCNWRHRESRWSIDQGTIEWRPITAAGANGPVSWHIRGDALPFQIVPLDEEGWFLLARETAVGEIEPLSQTQWSVVAVISTMDR